MNSAENENSVKIRTIDIEKVCLLDVIEQGLKEHAGDSDWSLCINITTGDQRMMHSTFDLSQWVVLFAMTNMVVEDSEGLYPDDKGYDFTGMAAWLVNETEAVPGEITITDDYGNEEIVYLNLV